jgi:hypothetical protein
MAKPAQGLQYLRVPVDGVRREALTMTVQDEPLEVGPVKVRRGVDPLGCAPIDEPSCAVVVPLDCPAAEVASLAVRQELLAQILQRDRLPRHRSSNVTDHDASSSPSRGRRPKTCPVLRRAVRRLVRARPEGTPKDLCGRRGPEGPDRALPAAACRPARRNAAGQTDLFSSGGGRESNPPGSSRPHTGFEDRGAHQVP